METMLFQSEKQSFYINPSLYGFMGIIGDILQGVYYQAGGGLPKNPPHPNSPLPSTCQILLRLTTEWVTPDKKKTYFSFVSEASVILDFTAPENKREVFMDFIEQSFSEHFKLLEIDREKLTVKWEAQVPDNKTKELVYENLNNYFESMF